MVSVRKEKYKDLLKECFATDEELLEKWHIQAGDGLDACVSRTWNDLQSADVKVFALMDEDVLAGYYGIEQESFLSGFFLKPEYRTSNNIKEFWTHVDNHFKGDYSTGIYKKNVRAINFLKRRAKKILEVPQINALWIVIDREK